jgi:hypothetical protein
VSEAPPPFRCTRYFADEVRRRGDRAGITDADIIAVLKAPARRVVQPDGRVRYWGWVARAGRWLRVVTLEDGETVHNAFFDRRFEP